jgi:hypothetical protein
MKKILILAKIFSCEKYMQDFIDGKLYMNNIEFFKKDDNVQDYARLDFDEGVKHFNPKNSEFELNGHKFDMNNMVSINLTKQNDMYKNIFCMYALSTDENGEFKKDDIYIDEKNKEFGKYVVVLTNPSKFLEKIKKAVEKDRLNTTMGLVEYCNIDDYAGCGDEKLIFKKLEEYKYQKEYRIAIDTGLTNKEPYVLDIGSIKDIVEVTNIDEFNKNIKIVDNEKRD